MIRIRQHASLVLLGACLGAASSAWADDYVVLGNGIATPRIGDRCAEFGPGYTDVGNGLCGRVTRHVRVYVTPRATTGTAPASAWASSGTANAAMRSDGMVPSTTNTRLPVRGGLDGYLPYR